MDFRKIELDRVLRIAAGRSQLRRHMARTALAKELDEIAKEPATDPGAYYDQARRKATALSDAIQYLSANGASNEELAELETQLESARFVGD